MGVVPVCLSLPLLYALIKRRPQITLGSRFAAVGLELAYWLACTLTDRANELHTLIEHHMPTVGSGLLCARSLLKMAMQCLIFSLRSFILSASPEA